MRLPFGLGRRGSSAVADAARPTSGAEAQPAAVSPRRAWADLPAIQRTVGEMPLVAAPASFAERLPGTTGLPPIVQPLGHEVSPLATPGIVVAHVRTATAPIGGALPAPVQRRASRPGAIPVSTDVGHDEPADATAAPAPSDGAMPGPAAPRPVRGLPTIARESIRVPDRPLTSAAAVARAQVAQRAATMTQGALPAPHAGMRRVPTPTPAAPPTVGREPARPAAAPATTVEAPGSPSRERARPGLGAPLPSLPAAARPIAQRTPAVGAPARARNSAPPRPHQAPTPAQATAIAASPAAGHPIGAQSSSQRPLPVLPVARAVRRDAPEPAASPGPVPVAAVVRPTLGVRPLQPAPPIQPSVGVQRAAHDDADGDAGSPEASAPASEMPIPWWAAATAPESAVQRSPLGQPAAPAWATDQTVLPSSASPAPAGVTAQRTLSVLPGTTTNRSLRSRAGSSGIPGAAPLAVARATAAAPPTPRPHPPAARGPVAPTGPASATGGGTLGAPVVQTSLASPSTAAAAPRAMPAPAAPALSAIPVVQRVDGAAPRPDPTSVRTVRSERELDELAQALFGRIRGRIRSELIHDREAKGLTFDNV